MRIKQKAEYGDFQTPALLARQVCQCLAEYGTRPKTIVEPTCGIGSFLRASAERFTDANRIIGIEINPAYVEQAKAVPLPPGSRVVVDVRQGDFFGMDCDEVFSTADEPILVIGNPPWATNACLSVLGSSNVPKKSNFQGYTGLDAITGKANFDISEWMMIRLLESLNGRRATMAMLCKSIVARKVLLHAWKKGLPIRDARIYSIDAAGSFGAAVDACLLVCDLASGNSDTDCPRYDALGDRSPSSTLGYRDGLLLANMQAYEQWKHLRGNSFLRWRSGIKHDCGSVMEMCPEGEVFRNGLNEIVDVEPQFLYPMRKSSEIAQGTARAPRRWMLVTQQRTGQDTARIAVDAPKTWKYLLQHADALDKRGSSIYRKRPRFSIFGTGDYAFAPWKVAISGFYKHLGFAVTGPYRGKPVVLDDTSYFLPNHDEEQARIIHELLSSDISNEFYSAFIFWDAKRPITVDVLQQLDLLALAKQFGVARQLKPQPAVISAGQGMLFDREMNANT